jgi:hypothetical protein
MGGDNQTNSRKRRAALTPAKPAIVGRGSFLHGAATTNWAKSARGEGSEMNWGT